jgi:hypothetical protein
MRRTLWLIGGALALTFLLTCPAAMVAEKEPGAADGTPGPEQAVFEMQEISVFKEFKEGEADEFSPYDLVGGLYTLCSTEPNEQVKAYPKLNSKQPLYGSLPYDQDLLNPYVQAEFHFVLDESGEDSGEDSDEDSGEAPDEASQPEASPSLLEKLTEALTGQLQQSDAPAQAPVYDRLYFDFNRDLDLTNDPVVRLMKNPPPELFLPGEKEENVHVFDYLDVPFDYGPELGTRPFRILAKFRPSFGPSGGYALASPTRGYMQFISTVARKGTIRLGEQEYTALLAQGHSITGWFNRPGTALRLTPADAPKKPRSPYRLDLLCVMREVDGELYDISATPTGDKLIVTPYRGELGLLEVGAGGRDVEKLGAIGMFISERPLLLTLGEFGGLPSPDVEKPRRHRLPVGDYAAMSLTVDVGRVQARFYPNRLGPDGSPDSQPKRPACTIKIRKDKPFILDFSEKPKVVFTGPTKDQTFKPGDAIQLEAVLIDPELDLMIAGLNDTTRKEGEMSFALEGGEPVTIPRYASLDPTVVIADASGKEVAAGKMPFG